jgi:hypothetical protein
MWYSSILRPTHTHGGLLGLGLPTNQPTHGGLRTYDPHTYIPGHTHTHLHTDLPTYLPTYLPTTIFIDFFYLPYRLYLIDFIYEIPFFDRFI